MNKFSKYACSYMIITLSYIGIGSVIISAKVEAFDKAKYTVEATKVVQDARASLENSRYYTSKLRSNASSLRSSYNRVDGKLSETRTKIDEVKNSEGTISTKETARTNKENAVATAKENADESKAERVKWYDENLASILTKSTESQKD